MDLQLDIRPSIVLVVILECQPLIQLPIPFHFPHKPSCLPLNPKFTDTATKRPRQRIVGPNLSWYLAALRWRIMFTRQTYRTRLYINAAHATAVNPHAAEREI